MLEVVGSSGIRENVEHKAVRKSKRIGDAKLSGRGFIIIGVDTAAVNVGWFNFGTSWFC